MLLRRVAEELHAPAQQGSQAHLPLPRGRFDLILADVCAAVATHKVWDLIGCNVLLQRAARVVGGRDFHLCTIVVV